MTESDLYAFIAAFLVAIVGTRAIELLARRLAVFAPVNWRAAHSRPTPRLAGPALACALAVGLLVGMGSLDDRMITVFAGGAVLLALGLADDLRGLPILPRSGVHVAVAAATAFVVAPELIFTLPVARLEVEGWLAVVLAAVWIVLMVNVFNFMDGIDGLVAGTTTAIAVTLLLLGGSAGHAFAIALAGACLGFLVWNHHPATIFMGDGGSHVLGYAVATAFLLEAREIEAVPVLLAVAPFLADVSATLLRRVIDRKDILRAHNEHLFQRLVRSGWSQRTVAGGYVIAALASGLAARTYVAGGGWWQLVALIAVVAAWALVFARVPNPVQSGPPTQESRP